MVQCLCGRSCTGPRSPEGGSVGGTATSGSPHRAPYVAATELRSHGGEFTTLWIHKLATSIRNAFRPALNAFLQDSVLAPFHAAPRAMPFSSASAVSCTWPRSSDHSISSPRSFQSNEVSYVAHP